MIFRVLFGVVVLFVLSLFLDWSFIANLSPWQYVASTFLVLVLSACIVFEVERLRALSQGVMSRAEMMRTVLIGYFVMNFTPSSFGGDGYKVYALGQHTSYSAAAALVFLERTLGLLVLLLVAALTVVFLGQAGDDVIRSLGELQFESQWSPAKVSVMLGIILLTGALVLCKWHAPLLRFVGEFLRAIRSLPARALAGFIAMTLCLHWARAFLLCFMVQVFDHQLNPGQAWLVLTAAGIASMLPISPGGLGVREAAMVAAMAPFGIGYQVALLAGLMFRLPNILQAALGALLSPSLRDLRTVADDAPEQSGVPQEKPGGR